MKQFLLKYWFLLGLGAAMVFGFSCATGLEAVSSWVWLRRSIVMSVMFLMALPLPLAMIQETLRRPGAALLATTINYGLLPIVAIGLAGLVDPVFYAGFLVVAATPCTLASAAVWTRRAGGNEVTALMTTVITNLASFVMTPLIVLILLNQTAEVAFGDMVFRLGLLVLLPIAVAQVLAANHSVGKWAQQRKKRLGVAAQIGILMIVLLGMAQTTLKLPVDQTPGLLNTLLLLVVCGVLHVVVLGAGFWLAKLAKFTRADQIAVAISGSQKTLMIGLLVCILLNVSLVPMVVYHAVQLIIDTFVADRFASAGPS